MQNDLLQKYNTPVPRYTSYPPANFFTDGYTASDYQKALDESNSWEPKAISLYFHIPFCKKMCFYCGCNSCPMADNKTVTEYLGALKEEIKLVSRHLNNTRLVSQVHFGGGTPNSIPVAYLREIMELLFATFTFEPKAEIAIECNPAYLDYLYLDELKKSGFNRFSLGIQDFNDKVLKGVNRDPSALPVADIIQYLKNGKNEIAVNLDFIYGLPYQTIDGFAETIQKAIALRPDRLVTFSYAHVPWVNKNQNILEKKGLPGNEDKTKMFESGRALLLKNGYKPIGFDHFVLESDELYVAQQTGTLHRNFQGYCTRNTTGQVYAFGVSGISQLHKAYAQNTKSVEEYISTIRHGELPIKKGYSLNDREIATREVITELMCNRQLNWPVIAAQFNMEVKLIKELVHYNESMLKQFSDDGIIEYSDNLLTVTDLGMMFIRNVASSFDPLLNTQNKQYSKPV
jgi:oxygen-independent coproporphyrinogen-3 oxidase